MVKANAKCNDSTRHYLKHLLLFKVSVSRVIEVLDVSFEFNLNCNVYVKVKKRGLFKYIMILPSM